MEMEQRACFESRTPLLKKINYDNFKWFLLQRIDSHLLLIPCEVVLIWLPWNSSQLLSIFWSNSSFLSRRSRNSICDSSTICSCWSSSLVKFEIVSSDFNIRIWQNIFVQGIHSTTDAAFNARTWVTSCLEKSVVFEFPEEVFSVKMLTLLIFAIACFERRFFDFIDKKFDARVDFANYCLIGRINCF